MSESEIRAAPPTGTSNPKKMTYACGQSSLRHFLPIADDEGICAILFGASPDAASNVRACAVLTRELLAADGAVALVANDDPCFRLLSEAERAASLDAFMQSRPAGDVWVFAYGSLIWNPALKAAERRIARVEGLHRTFCLSMPVGRGTPALPGLALGLDHGGDCLGVAYRIADDDITSELHVLWGREMLLGGYTPRWVEIVDSKGTRFGHAVTFVIDADHDHYAGGISPRSTIQRLATAVGSWGSAADYLFRTIEALRINGIHDANLERVGTLVEAAMLLSIWPQAA